MQNAQRSQRCAGMVIWLFMLVASVSCGGTAEGRPQVWIDSPGDGMSFPSGSTIQVISHAYAREGVAEVVLSVNGEAYRRDAPSSPGAEFAQFNQNWLPAGGGIYAIQVVAYDTQGEASNPQTITIEVKGDAGPTPVGGCPTPVGGGPTPVSCLPVVSGCPSPVGGGPTPVSCLPVVSGCPSPVGGGPTPVSCAPETGGDPVPPGSVIQFWAEPAEIPAGSCTNIRWHVENAGRVVFGGIDQPFDGSYKDCLCGDQQYTLTVIHQDGTEERRTAKITVSGSCVNAEPPPPAQDTTPPPVPSPAVPQNGLVLSCRSSQTLAWLPVSDDLSGIAGYYVKLEREVTKGNWQSEAGFGPISDKQVSVNVNCGGIYRWMVRAQDGAGNFSNWSAASNFSINLN